MRAVVQRVQSAKVTVDGQVVGAIEHGLLLYLGFAREDQAADFAYIAKKIVGLRVFSDAEGMMNRSVEEVGGAVLAVSQFTLQGDARKGRRPSYNGAMEPGQAIAAYGEFVNTLKGMGLKCATGTFGAHMEVQSVNDGPVTILLDSTKLF